MRKLAIEAKARAHKGVDIAAPTGTGVFTTAEGRVVRAGYQAGGYGNFIEVKHPNGLSSVYAHLSRIDVHTGPAIRPARTCISRCVATAARSTPPRSSARASTSG